MEHTCNTHAWKDEGRVSHVRLACATWTAMISTDKQTKQNLQKKNVILSKPEKAHIYHLVDGVLLLLEIILDKHNSDSCCCYPKNITGIHIFFYIGQKFKKEVCSHLYKR